VDPSVECQRKMEIKKVTVFSEVDNNVVIKLPEWDYMGSVVPIDMLFLMHGEVMDIVEELKYNPGSDVFYSAFSLAKSIEKRLEHYIEMCEEHNLEPEFSIELSVLDYQDLLI